MNLENIIEGNYEQWGEWGEWENGGKVKTPNLSVSIPAVSFPGVSILESLSWSLLVEGPTMASRMQATLSIPNTCVAKTRKPSLLSFSIL